MKIFIILGSGNSGAGAIHDYLASREDFLCPFKGKEFRLVNDPDGIDDLFNAFYNYFNINLTADKFERFNKFTTNIYYSNYNIKYKILDKKFLVLTKNFMKKIIQIEYNGSPRFFFDKMNLLKKVNFYFKRFILGKSSKNIRLLNMVIPVDQEDFLKACEKYLHEIFKLNNKFDKKKNIVIEQGGNFFKPAESTKYYGSNREIILVTRDPKAIFWSMKRRQSLAYPGHDIELFVKWYRAIMKNAYFNEDNKITHIKYENFFSDFTNQKKILCSKLNLDPNIKDNFNLEFTKKNLFKFEKNLSNSEKEYINDHLKEYV